jgi:hypothetical protein
MQGEEGRVGKRSLIVFLCAAIFQGVLGTAALRSESRAFAGVEETGEAAKAPSKPAQKPDPAYLVREVVYNELHDHDTHGYWRYWIQKHSEKGTQLQEQVETKDGPVARVQLANGSPLAASAQEEEDRRLQRLLTSPSEQAQHRKDYADDEKRIGRILALLPDAFVYEPAELEARSERMPECACYHMRFHPNPNYPAHSIEARIFHAMAGDLWISVDQKRLVRLDGKLEENVDFGYGILGRLYKDGWFRLERTHVTAAGASNSGDWKTQRLEIHMNGRAMLFKTIARETSEVRGGFEPVASGLSLAQAAVLVSGRPRSLPGILPEARSVALITTR